MFISWARTSIRWEVGGISQEISEGGINCEFQNGKGGRTNRPLGSAAPQQLNYLLVMAITADELLTGNNSFGREAAQ